MYTYAYMYIVCVCVSKLGVCRPIYLYNDMRLYIIKKVYIGSRVGLILGKQILRRPSFGER